MGRAAVDEPASKIIYPQRRMCMQYEDMVFKIPMESDTYKEDSDFVFRQRRGAGLATAQVKNTGRLITCGGKSRKCMGIFLRALL